jgi:hypothetical protein
MNTGSVQDQLLAEQRAYYSALAPDYFDQLPDLPGGAELTEALDAFRPAGSVLDLACGPGTWIPSCFITPATLPPSMRPRKCSRSRRAASLTARR